MPRVRHGADRQRDRRNVHRGRRHQAGRRRLVTANGEDDPIERVAEQNFDEPQVGEISIERCGRALTRFLDRMNRKLQRYTASGANALAHTFGQYEVVAVAWAQVRTSLCDPDDRLARLQFLQREGRN